MTAPPAIINWQRIDERITTSGQPSEPDLAALRDMGVRHVINLALHSHEQALPDERASVEALGMSYTHIPVAFDAPTDADFRAFAAELAATGDAPVHVHCILNARVTAFFYRHRAETGGDAAGARMVMDRVWRPGGVWAAFIGDPEAAAAEHRFAGRDY